MNYPYSVKLIVGFRRDQEHSIPAAEAHKAYYLFLNPEKRGVFANGLAIKGDQIQEIVPDWQGSMGWNPTHTLDSDDWNEIRDKGVDGKLRNLIMAAKEIAYIANPEDLNKPLQEVIETKYPHLLLNAAPRQGKMKPLKELL